MRTTAKLVADGRLTVPQPIREALGLQEGDLVAIDIEPVNAGYEQVDETDQSWNPER